MPNRSTFPLPAIYADATADWYNGQTPTPRELEIFDISYLHYHDTLEIGLCVEGSGVCCVEDKTYPFFQGDIQIIFPFQRHLSKSTGNSPSKWYWLNIDPIRALSDWGAPDTGRVEVWLHTGMGLCGIIDRDRFPEIARLTRRLIEVNLGITKIPSFRNTYLNIYLYMLILELVDASKEMPKLFLRPNKYFSLLTGALEKIKSCLQDGKTPSVELLAKQCNISVATLRRLFHSTIGQSPRDYITTARLRKAQQLLMLTDASVVTIALSTGFEDVSGFNRFFQKFCRVTPTSYRKLYSSPM